MKILTGDEIVTAMNRREIVIEPRPRNEDIDAISVDLRLDNYFGEFTITEEACIDLAEDFRAIEFVEKEYFEESYILHPKRFVLAQTLEYIVLPRNVFAQIDGRSSLGRRGLLIHVTAGHVDPGWKGRLTLELANLGEMPVKLYPFMKICRLTFYKLPIKVASYKGGFAGQLKIKLPGADPYAKRIKEKLEKDTNEKRKPLK